MKTTKAVLALTVALAGFTAADSAFAQHRHRHHGSRLSIGLAIGLPLAAYSYYNYPRYAYYPPYYPPVVVQQQAPVYVEQNPPPAAVPQPSSYWYYCADSRAYYPYVKECQSGWQRVTPQPG